MDPQPRLTGSARRLLGATGRAGRTFRIAAVLAGSVALTGLGSLAPSQQAEAGDARSFLGALGFVVNDPSDSKTTSTLRAVGGVLGATAANRALDGHGWGVRQLATGPAGQLGGHLAARASRHFEGASNARVRPASSGSHAFQQPRNVYGSVVHVSPREPQVSVPLARHATHVVLPPAAGARYGLPDAESAVRAVDRAAHDPNLALVSHLLQTSQTGYGWSHAKVLKVHKPDRRDPHRGR